MATTGAVLPPTPPTGWDGPFTRSAGGHDDVAAIVFAPGVSEDACPVLFSSDGGVYFNTKETSPDCHRPFWQQPNVTPHALWLWALAGSNQPGVLAEDLYFGNQDNGSFGTTNAGAPSPTWTNRDCCDGFDDSSNLSRVLYTICCFSPPPGNRLFLRNPGMAGGAEINTYPPGALPGFRPVDVIGNFGATDFVVVTTQGVFITNNVTATPIVWTQLGAATSPPGACGIKLGMAGGQPTFFVQAGVCDGRAADQLWRFVGSNPAGAWVRIDSNLPGGGVGVFAVDPGNPTRLYASNLTPTGPRMMFSTDSGTTWTNDTGLDSAMTGGGAFVYQNRRGPTAFTGFGGYPQPTLVAFDPQDPNILVAGGADSGVFVSTDGGGSWSVITDPITSGTSGKPHLPRPWFVHFDHEPPNRVKVYVGTQGRGVWRAEFEVPEPRFEYAAKLVCGIQNEPANLRLAQGLYATTINVHNPNQQTAVFKKKLALSFPPAEQRPGKVLPISQDTLREDEALAVDCIDIQKRLFPNGFPTPYIEGFIVIRSIVSLDVTAVYSTGVAGKDECCRASKTNPSIDVVQIRERIIAQAPRQPDLVPVNPQPNAGRLGFCRRDPSSGRLVVTVRNQGVGPAGPSHTNVNFTTGTTVTSVTVNTPTIPAGTTVDVMAAIPAGCFTPDCAFQIVVDSASEVAESNETNNVADGLCRG